MPPYKGQQLKLPGIDQTKPVLHGIMDTLSEIRDGRTVVVLYDQEGLQEPLAEALNRRFGATFCCMGDEGTFKEHQGISTPYAFIIFKGGHEISRRTEPQTIEDLLSWIEGVLE